MTALFALWPGRPPDRIRKDAATALEDLADLLEAKALAAGPTDRRSVDDDRLAALAARAVEATAAVRDGFVAVPRRPNGVGRRPAALGRLIDDLDWLDNLAREQPGPAASSSAFAAERATVEASIPAALSAAASGCEGTIRGRTRRSYGASKPMKRPSAAPFSMPSRHARARSTPLA